MAFDSDKSPRAILDELATHPHGDRITRLIHTLAMSAYDERRSALDQGLDEALTQMGVDEASAETSFGNVVRALRKQASTSGRERTLLGALVARGVVRSPPDGREANRRIADALAWLSAHTIIDPLAALEDALAQAPALPSPNGEATGLKPVSPSEGLYSGLVDTIRAHDEGRSGTVDRASALLATLALARGRAKAAVEGREALRSTTEDPTIASLLAPMEVAATSASSTLVVVGEEASPPRSSFVTLLLTVTLILPLMSLAKLFGRFALRLRRPAELAFSKEGVRVRSRIEVLGKIVREREVFLTAPNLVRAAREVRYPRLPTYVGIVALLVGSYFGLRFVLDGLRAGSPEFLGFGLAVLIAALGLDYGLTLLPSRTPSRCRLVLQPSRGKTFAFARVDRVQAEAALRTLKV